MSVCFNCYIIISSPEKLQRTLIHNMCFRYAGVEFITNLSPSLSHTHSFLSLFKTGEVLNALQCASALGFCSKFNYHLKFKHHAALKALQNRIKKKQSMTRRTVQKQQQNGDISANVPQPYFSLSVNNQLQNYFWHLSL